MNASAPFKVNLPAFANAMANQLNVSRPIVGPRGRFARERAKRIRAQANFSSSASLVVADSHSVVAFCKRSTVALSSRFKCWARPGWL